MFRRLLIPHSLLLRRLTVMTALVASASAGSAVAATLKVANNGVDSATCGAKTDPCRSLSQTIANATAGDKIIVGPGRYGDLNGDGVFDQPGEEPAEIGSGCFCMIHVNKVVKIVSRDGAAATVLHGGGASVRVVHISADGATFGGLRKGFTLTGSNGRAGLDINSVASGVIVIGNLSVANTRGFEIPGSEHVIESNVAIANSQGFRSLGAQGVRFDGNVAIANGSVGFDISSGLDHVVIRNVASANGLAGFGLGGSDFSVKLNVASANGETGFTASSTSGSNNHKFTRNTAVGNGRVGIGVFSPMGTGAIIRNNLFGTFDSGSAPTNCGLRNVSGDSVDASRNYWGAADGPGADPADDVCGSGVIVDPVSKREKKVRPRRPKL